jgi:hypothetical protein
MLTASVASIAIKTRESKIMVCEIPRVRGNFWDDASFLPVHCPHEMGGRSPSSLFDQGLKAALAQINIAKS